MLINGGGAQASLTIEQILWHLNTSTAGAEHYYLTFSAHIARIILLVIVYLLISKFLCSHFRNINHRVQKLFLIGYSFVLLLSTSLVCLYTDKHLSIVDFIKVNVVDDMTNQSDFIADNYHLPNEIKHDVRHNLVVVMVESLEQNYKDNRTIENLKTIQLNNKNNYSENLQRLNLTGWTISAMVGWHFGLPLKLPKGISHNSYEVDKFLPNAISIFDILGAAGYHNVLLMGSESHFSGMRGLFKTHGSFEIKDKKFYDESYSMNEYRSPSGWGYSDSFIFQRAKEEMASLIKLNKPYVLYIQTIDTHGLATGPADEKTYINTDQYVKDFIDYVKANSSNTAIAIIGDHTSWDNLDYTTSPHRMFNLFFPVDGGLKINNQAYSALDIAPTLLKMSGASWENEKFGMGVSMFSYEESLTNKFGANELNNLLMKNSSFYNGLF